MPIDPKDERKNSIKEGLNVDVEEDNNEKPHKNDNNQEAPDGNDGNGENDSYLEEEDSEKSTDEKELGNNNSVLSKTFDGDVSKLEKSYLEAQKSAGRQARELKELKSELDDLKNTKQVLDNNPTLNKLYNKAQQGEDVESLVTNRRSEPDNGKSDNSPSNDGKFDGIEDEFLPTEDKLVELGYLDEQFDSLNDFDKKASVVNAQQAYLSQNLPNIIEQNVREARKKVREEEKEQETISQLESTNEQRLEQGFDNAITKYGLDFSGEDKDLFDEIYNEVTSFRDRQDGRLIRENAVELATAEVLRQKGQVDRLSAGKPTNPSKSSDDNQENFSTRRSGSNVKSEKSDQELTLEERMSKRRANSAQRSIDQRRGLYNRG